MKLHPDTDRCAAIFDQLLEVLDGEENDIVQASALSLLLFHFCQRQKDPGDTAQGMISILVSMMVTFDHGVGPSPPDTRH